MCISKVFNTTFLVGGVENLADAHLEKINNEIEERHIAFANRKAELHSKLENTSIRAVAAKEQIENVLSNEKLRHESAIEKLSSRREYWASSPKFSFQFESVKQKLVIKRKSRTQAIKNWWVNKLTSKLG